MIYFKKKTKNAFILFILFAAFFLSGMNNLAFSNLRNEHDLFYNHKDEKSQKSENNLELDLDTLKVAEEIINDWKIENSGIDNDFDGINDELEQKLLKLKDSQANQDEDTHTKSLEDTIDLEDLIDEGSIKDQDLEITKDEIPIIVRFPQMDIASLKSYFKATGGNIKSQYRKAMNGFAGTIDYEGLKQFNRTLNANNIPFLLEADAKVQAQLYYNSRNMNLRPYIWNDLKYTGDNTTSIAILDTGIDESHSFFDPGYESGNFSKKIVAWNDMINVSSMPYDDNAHGTHCAGIAAGDGDINRDHQGRVVSTFAFGLNLSDSWFGYPETTIELIAARFNVTDPGHIEIPCNFTSYPSSDEIHTWAYLYHNEQIMDSYVVDDLSWTHNLSYNVAQDEVGDYSLRLTLDFEDIDGNAYLNDSAFKVRNEIHFPFSPSKFGAGNYWRGVAPDSRLASIKVLDEHGGGSFSEIIDGVEWAIANKTKFNISVISMSLGGSAGQSALISAVNNAVENGIITVVAAGNSGGLNNENNIGSPGDADNVITVAAMNIFDEVTEYSSSGGNSFTGNTKKPDLMAPGGSDYNFSMLSADTNDNDAEGMYESDSYWNDLYPAKGTSMATPAVAGAASLLIQAMGGQKNWNFTAEEAKRAKAILLMTATETFPLERETDTSFSPTLDRGGKDIHEGYGRINIDTAIEAVTNILSPNTNTSARIASSVDNPFERHAHACNVRLDGGENYKFVLNVPNGADFDLYMYKMNGSGIGEPILVSSSISEVIGEDERIDITPQKSGKYILVGKAISGQGLANITYHTNAQPPTLSSADLTPITGNQSTQLNYSVVYTDLDDIAPTYLHVLINNTPFSMIKQDASDNDYSDGCLYQFITYLQPATYNYSFECKDGQFTVKTTSSNNPSITRTNLQQPQLNNLGVDPPEGVIHKTDFKFSVEYKDPDNNAPEFVNITIDLDEYEMTKEDPYDSNYMDGAIYSFTTSLDLKGEYIYTFNCSDGDYSKTIGTFIGPRANDKLRNYTMQPYAPYQWIDASSGTELQMSDDDYSTQSLPFEFKFYNRSFSEVHISSNGYLSFTDSEPDHYINDPLPTNNSDFSYLIAPYWDDLYSPDGGHIYVDSASDYWVVEWEDIYDFGDDLIGSFEVILNKTGDIRFNYEYLNDTSYSYTCGLNLGLNTSFYNSFDSLNDSTNNFSIIFKRNPRNDYAPALTGGSANPLSGDQTTQLNFTVLYTDIDNNEPTSIKVIVNNTEYNMEKQNYVDKNYTDGCLYQSLIYLQPGNYDYKFQCSDYRYSNETQIYSGVSITGGPNSNAPTLNNARVTPKSGFTSITNFHFIVNYSDLDNNQPEEIYVNITGTEYTMQKQDPMDTNYMDGCLYEFIRSFSQSTEFTFSFFASDGQYNDSIGPYQGPTLKNPPLFDGMYIQHLVQFSSLGPEQYDSEISYQYSQNSIFAVNWSSPVIGSAWNVNISDRVLTNIDGSFFFDNDHTFSWIQNISLGKTVQLSVLGDGDHDFEVVGEDSYYISRVGSVNIWILQDTISDGYAWFEKSTGILLEGQFYYYGGAYSYTFEFKKSNVFEYDEIEDDDEDKKDKDDKTGIPGYNLFIFAGALIGVTILVLRKKIRYQ